MNWCLFISHLVVEKAVKAVFVLNNDNKKPPKTHNLLKLAKKSNLDLTNEQTILFKEITSFNIEARYPQYKLEFYKLCNREFTIEYFNKIQDIFKWIKFHIESKTLLTGIIFQYSRRYYLAAMLMVLSSKFSFSKCELCVSVLVSDCPA